MWLLAMLACSAFPGHKADAGREGDGAGAGDDGCVPTAEICNGVDDDCDGEIDEGAADALTWYADVDGDGAGDDAQPRTACRLPAGTSPVGGDCDDGDAAVSPRATESCDDGRDDDCDGLLDCEDADCARATACATEDCEHDRDADGDGLVGCEDPDCVAEAVCTSVSARVLGGQVAIRRVVSASGVSYSGLITSQQHATTSVVASGITGEVRVPTASGVVTCSWAVDRATFTNQADTHHPTSSGDTTTSGPIARDAVTLEPGCPLADASFLPDALTVDDERVHDPAGGVWYLGLMSSWNSQKSGTFPSGSGTVQFAHTETSSWTIDPLLDGDLWTP